MGETKQALVAGLRWFESRSVRDRWHLRSTLAAPSHTQRPSWNPAANTHRQRVYVAAMGTCARGKSMWVAVAIASMASCGKARPQPATCKKESPIQADMLSASSSNGSATGLLFPTHAPPIRSGDELKIVWHITGRGPLSIQYFDPSGAERPLRFGPTEHLETNFAGPGDDWGAGFKFDAKGCWHVRLTRSGTSADAWLAVR
jgi:hypothetical protein